MSFPVKPYVMKIAQNTFDLFFIVATIAYGVDGSLRFKVGSITALNQSFIDDDSTDTCATFIEASGSSTPAYSQFRIDVPFEESQEVSCIVTGPRLGCDRNLYVSPISAAESSLWTGRWRKCSLSDTPITEDVEYCLYKCNCSESFEQIQLFRIALATHDSSWTLCDIHFLFQECKEVPKSHDGVYRVKVGSEENIPATYPLVYCDMTTDGGGWTVILRRKDGSVEFERNWEDYKRGFGSLEGEFWAGNELIHQLTSDGRTYSVRFDLEAYDGDKIDAIYNNFSVGPESDNYRLHVSDYNETSTGGDSFSYNNNMMFTTSDRDNDMDVDNCATSRSPWWNNMCSRCFLAGRYGEYPTVPEDVGIKWQYDWGTTKFAKYATMMIRPN